LFLVAISFVAKPCFASVERSPANTAVVVLTDNEMATVTGGQASVVVEILETVAAHLESDALDNIMHEYVNMGLEAAYNYMVDLGRAGMGSYIYFRGDIEDALFYNIHYGTHDNPFKSSVEADYTNWDQSAYYTRDVGGWCDNIGSTDECDGGLVCLAVAEGFGTCQSGGDENPPI
jgi:hypothetical protein